MVKYYTFYVCDRLYALFYDIESNKYWFKDNDLSYIINRDYYYKVDRNWVNKIRTLYKTDERGVVIIPLGEYTICGIPNVDIKIALYKQNYMKLYINCPSKCNEFYLKIAYNVMHFFNRPDKTNGSRLVYLLGYDAVVQMFLQNNDCCVDLISFIFYNLFVVNNASINDCSTIYNLDE